MISRGSYWLKSCCVIFCNDQSWVILAQKLLCDILYLYLVLYKRTQKFLEESKNQKPYLSEKCLWGKYKPMYWANTSRYLTNTTWYCANTSEECVNRKSVLAVFRSTMLFILQISPWADWLWVVWNKKEHVPCQDWHFWQIRPYDRTLLQHQPLV